MINTRPFTDPYFWAAVFMAWGTLIFIGRQILLERQRTGVAKWWG